jgi:hypothetical protein
MRQFGTVDRLKLMITCGASTIVTGRGFRDIFTDANRNCPTEVRDFCNPDQTIIDASKPLYNFFAQLKLIF